MSACARNNEPMLAYAIRDVRSMTDSATLPLRPCATAALLIVPELVSAV